MGNICRSPSAEGFFAAALDQSPFKELVSIDSAGTHSYHIGHSPDPRAVETAAKFGVDIAHLRARKVRTADFHDFDLIIAMDRSNLEDLRYQQPPESKAHLTMMMTYHPEQHPNEVPDPYYGGIDGFTYMCKLLESATAGLLNDVEDRLS
jgi:protein-tyrosine phosphatase